MISKSDNTNRIIEQANDEKVRLQVADLLIRDRFDIKDTLIDDKEKTMINITTICDSYRIYMEQGKNNGDTKRLPPCKQPNDFFRKDKNGKMYGTMKYHINQVMETLNLPLEKVWTTRRNAGTWAHPEVATKLASELCPKLAVEVYSKYLMYVTGNPQALLEIATIRNQLLGMGTSVTTIFATDEKKDAEGITIHGTADKKEDYYEAYKNIKHDLLEFHCISAGLQSKYKKLDLASQQVRHIYKLLPGVMRKFSIVMDSGCNVYYTALEIRDALSSELKRAKELYIKLNSIYSILSQESKDTLKYKESDEYNDKLDALRELHGNEFEEKFGTDMAYISEEVYLAKLDDTANRIQTITDVAMEILSVSNNIQNTSTEEIALHAHELSEMKTVCDKQREEIKAKDIIIEQQNEKIKDLERTLELRDNKEHTITPKYNERGITYDDLMIDNHYLTEFIERIRVDIPRRMIQHCRDIGFDEELQESLDEYFNSVWDNITLENTNNRYENARRNCSKFTGKDQSETDFVRILISLIDNEPTDDDTSYFTEHMNHISKLAMENIKLKTQVKLHNNNIIKLKKNNSLLFDVIEKLFANYKYKIDNINMNHLDDDKQKLYRHMASHIRNIAKTNMGLVIENSRFIPTEQRASYFGLLGIEDILCAKNEERLHEPANPDETTVDLPKELQKIKAWSMAHIKGEYKKWSVEAGISYDDIGAIENILSDTDKKKLAIKYDNLKKKCLAACEKNHIQLDHNKKHCNVCFLHNRRNPIIYGSDSKKEIDANQIVNYLGDENQNIFDTDYKFLKPCDDQYGYDPTLSCIDAGDKIITGDTVDIRRLHIPEIIKLAEYHLRPLEFRGYQLHSRRNDDPSMNYDD